MEKLVDFFRTTWDFILSQARGIGITDVIDIILVTLLFYYIFKFIRNRRAGRLLIGVIFLIVVQIISELVGLVAINYILRNIFQVGILALIVLFQPELRSMLEKVGAEPLRSLKNIGEQTDITELQNTVSSICDAVAIMAEEKTGALIVLERDTPLGDYTTPKGTVVDSSPSSDLIRNIFFNKSPLHDGALIVRPPRLYAAGCMLPLSTNSHIIGNLGTRHRAAIGISENSDALAVVVSEETGIVSVAVNGKLYRGFDKDRLSKVLTKLFIDSYIRKKSAQKQNKGKHKDADTRSSEHSFDTRKGDRP